MLCLSPNEDTERGQWARQKDQRRGESEVKSFKLVARSNVVAISIEPQNKMTGVTTQSDAEAGVSRHRSVSVDNSSSDGKVCSKVAAADYCCAGIRGKYSGDVDLEGRPHGHGSFVREGDDGVHNMTYVGIWNHGYRVGEGRYYSDGNLLGNVVWD